MSRPSRRGDGPGQPPFQDQQDSAGCGSSHSGGRFERTDDANYAGTYSSTEIPSADAQPSTASGARWSAGKTKLSILDRFEKGDDGPPTSDRPAIALAPRPTSIKRDFAASRISARHSVPLGLNADSVRIPRYRCDVPNPAIVYNIGSRSRRRAVEESSESEARAIAVRHSKWATFGTPNLRASQEIEERERKDDCHESSGVLESTRSRSVENTGWIDHGSNTGRKQGPDLQHLHSTRHLDLGDLIEATIAQLARTVNTERGLSALEFGDDQPWPESLEEKVAAWDPCQEDNYALSTPGELELFQLDMFDPSRRTRRPKPPPRKAAFCCASKSSCDRSPSSPPKSKKVLPVTAADSSMYEDLHCFNESCEQPATSPPLCDVATTATASTPRAEARPDTRSTKAGATKRQSDKAIARPSTKPRRLQLLQVYRVRLVVQEKNCGKKKCACLAWRARPKLHL